MKAVCFLGDHVSYRRSNDRDVAADAWTGRSAQ
jgi:hypothetical protein